MLLIWGYDQSRRLRHNGTTGKLRMARMRDLPVGQRRKQMCKLCRPAYACSYVRFRDMADVAGLSVGSTQLFMSRKRHRSPSL
jgi:hypothetical protein